MDPHAATHLRLGIIADDLTGAADTALSFWETGIAATIQLDLAEGAITTTSLAAIAVDTDSRHLAPDEAGQRVAQAIRHLQAAGIDRFYKKIDSTLRGNIGAEIEAALDATQASHAIVCPAFPATGRTVVHGRVQVDGVDLMETSIATDPRNPVPSSRIAEVLAEQTHLPITELATPDDNDRFFFPPATGARETAAEAAPEGRRPPSPPTRATRYSVSWLKKKRSSSPPVGSLPTSPPLSLRSPRSTAGREETKAASGGVIPPLHASGEGTGGEVGVERGGESRPPSVGAGSRPRWAEGLGPSPRRQIIVVDAATAEALDQWLHHFGLDQDILWVGSAGLAQAIARTIAAPSATSSAAASPIAASVTPADKIRPVPWPFRARNPQSRARIEQTGPGTLGLVVAGSLHSACRDQLAALLALPAVASFAVQPARIIQGQAPVDQIAARIAQTLGDGKHCALYTEAADAAKQELERALSASGQSREWAGERIVQWLGQVVAIVTSAHPDLAGLVLTGGDTARAVMRALDIPSLRIVGAVAAGVPIGQAPDRPLRLVTKAGGFGKPDILVRALHALTNNQ
jgi:uncharacterized protein YgbK (DUF1537 family)